MTDGDSDGLLYPNEGRERAARPGLSRRTVLAGSAALGSTAAAGCSATDDATTTTSLPGERDTPTVFVFNTGDRTVSVIDPETDSVVTTTNLGVTSSFPSNQYTPTLTVDPTDPLWLNVGRGVSAFGVGSLTQQARTETGSGANWLEQTPDGKHLVVSAREPAHTQFRLDADPASSTFGEVTGELDRTDEGGYGDNDGPGPCDITVHPDGHYAYVPDLFGDTLTVLDIEAFESVTQVDVEPVGSGPARPWMGTASPDGGTLLVEHNEGGGTESVWDLGDPENPVERVRLTSDDGLGSRPLTSEIGPDSETGYVFTPGSNDVTVVDLVDAEVTGRIDLGGSAFVGTWEPGHEKLYVPVQTADEVAVIDHTAGEIVERIPVGSKPYGATAARVRPAAQSASDRALLLSALDDQSGTTYCIGNCACGHQL